MGCRKHFRPEAAARARQSHHFPSATIQYGPRYAEGTEWTGGVITGSGQKVQFSPIQVSPEGPSTRHTGRQALHVIDGLIVSLMSQINTHRNIFIMSFELINYPLEG